MSPRVSFCPTHQHPPQHHRRLLGIPKEVHAEALSIPDRDELVDRLTEALLSCLLELEEAAEQRRAFRGSLGPRNSWKWGGSDRTLTRTLANSRAAATSRLQVHVQYERPCEAAECSRRGRDPQEVRPDPLRFVEPLTHSGEIDLARIPSRLDSVVERYVDGDG